jgi:hypothetical protein
VGLFLKSTKRQLLAEDEVMKIKTRTAAVLSCAILSWLMALPGLPFASPVEDDEYARSTLRGLPGVYVAVEALDPDVQQDGLTKATLQADAELRLRMAGIKVLSREEWAKTQGGPVCYIDVSIVKDVGLTHVLDFDLYAFEVSVELHQDVALVRDMAVKVLSPTWSASYVGFTNALPRIRTKVTELVERFINAYQAVNPK